MVPVSRNPPRFTVQSFRLFDRGAELLAGHRAPLERFAAALNAAPPADDTELAARVRELVNTEPGYSFAPHGVLLTAWGPYQPGTGNRGKAGGR